MPENDVAIAAIDSFIAEQSIDRSKDGWKTSLPQPPQVEFDASKRYFWNVATNIGDIKIQLMPDIAPMHVSSTIYLARLGFYDGVIFHRVITGFMAQGGDPLGQGIGGPGYNYNGEFSSSARHDRPGLLSMANAGTRHRRQPVLPHLRPDTLTSTTSTPSSAKWSKAWRTCSNSRRAARAVGAPALNC